jgi:hypothetical protein
VGESYSRQLGQQLAEKAAVAPARLGNAVIDKTTDSVLDALNAQWNSFIENDSPARGARALVGYLPNDVLDTLAKANSEPKITGITIEDHTLRNAKVEIKNLPELMVYPQAILLDNISGEIIYVVAPVQSTSTQAVKISYDNSNNDMATARLENMAIVITAFENGALTLIRGSL